MNVNRTRFHLVLGPNDWGSSVPPAAGQPEWNASDGTVALRGLPFVFPERKSETPLTPDVRRGAASDRYGTWYWIDTDGRRIRARGRDAREAETFWPVPGAAATPRPAGAFQLCAPAGPRPAPALRGLCLTTDHFLVVGTESPIRGLLVFDLYGGGEPLMHAWPDDVPFAPWDLAATADGGLWVLDAATPALWSLDRWFRPRLPRWMADAPSLPDAPDLFTPADGSEDERRRDSSTGSAVTRDFAIPVPPLDDPVAVDALPDGSALVLGLGSSGAEIVRVRSDGMPAGRASLGAALTTLGLTRPLLERGHDLAVVGEPLIPGRPGMPPDPVVARGTLYVVGPDGNQSFRGEVMCTDDDLALSLARDYLPMRRFTGKAIVASGVPGEAAVYYDAEGERWIRLVEQSRTTYERETTILLPAEGGAFDGHEPGCVWHRAFLDACIPPDTSVTIESRAADDAQNLAWQPWQPEPMPYLRRSGAEIPTYTPRRGGASAATGTWETLFQSATGRWLQLRVTLRGPGRLTPRLRALRVYYPRFSYLREYLPATYRDDDASAAFLDRLLANVEGTFTDIEERIAHADALFDVRTLPAEFLDWLATWLGDATLDPAWSESTRRLFLAHAMDMYRTRGTRRGLVRSLRLALDSAPDASLFDPRCDPDATPGAFTVRVVEHFMRRQAPGVLAGDPTDVLGPGSTTNTLAWTPAQGAAVLHERWRAWLQSRYATIAALDAAWGTTHGSWQDADLQLDATSPANAARAVDWSRFLREALGFVYEPVDAGDLPLWRAYLAYRYRNPGELARAWALPANAAPADFNTIPLPAALPAGGTRLQDWIRFVSQVVPTKRNAHRFTVLVPVGLNDEPDLQRQRLGIAARVTERERPAHAQFDVRLYWAMLRVGESRLGLDTVLGSGSRFVALVLGRGSLGAVFLDRADRWRAPAPRLPIPSESVLAPSRVQP